MMIWILLLGALLGGGALVCASAFASQPLSEIWNRHETDPEQAPAWLNLDDPTPLGLAGSVISRLLMTKPIAEIFDESEFPKDLAVVGKDRVDFAAHVLVKAVIVLGVGIALVFSPQDRLPASRLLTVTIGAAALVVLLEIKGIQKKAKRHREEVLEAITAFVEFTRLAAHSQSVEGAMRAAVRMGASWPFRRLEIIFDQAARHREAPWRGITAMGHSYGMLELVELGGALENAGVEGTRVQSMLAAKSTSLRRRMTEAEIERANSATQQLSVPLGLLGVVLVAVLLTPALLAF